MTETHAQFQARIRRERKARAETARASLASYYAQSPAALDAERFARGEYVNIFVAADGTRTVVNGPGL